MTVFLFWLNMILFEEIIRLLLQSNGQSGMYYSCHVIQIYQFIYKLQILKSAIEKYMLYSEY